MAAVRALVLLAAAACSSTERPASVARAQASDGDAGASGLTWVDFAVAGCPRYDPGRPTCEGAAPLELRFAAVAPAPIASYLWTFGDGSEAAVSATPTHTFRMPGTYAVGLTVGGAGGTAEARRDMFVTVTPAGEGGACEVSGQCGVGLDCPCGSGCPGGGLRGFCARRCDVDGSCAGGRVCVDLGPRGGADDGWPGRTCLPSCARDADCAAPFVCREVAGPSASWVRACFPQELLGDEGASCAGAAGAPEDRLCLGGACAAMGARGLCAATCDASRPCPSYALCAQLASGERRCLARCSAARPCDDDPFLACQTSNGAGRLGFTLSDPEARVCAPKRCQSAGACGPDGICDAGFCVKREG
jgi:hypothetical protein